MPAPAAPDLPDDEQYARNLIGGRWRFPAAPYEFEIRDPLDSTVITTVPLSSRFDVADAVAAARDAAPKWAGDAHGRRHHLGRLVDALHAQLGPLAAAQSRESGLAVPDSVAATRALVQAAEAFLAGHQWSAAPPGVSGHVLSWGLPLAETVCATLPALATGRTVVVKPSLRAPLSATAVAHLATRCGWPPGVLNLVQGTGIDAGAALVGTRELADLWVRAGERTLAQASRATTVTGVPLRTLRAGGNVALVGPDADLAAVAAAVAAAVRVHNAGGPGALAMLAVADTVAGPAVDAILAALATGRPAPLPTEPLRQRALARVTALCRGGARLLTGGRVPDDIPHRMGWLIPPTVLDVGAWAGVDPTRPDGPIGDPLGPVLTVGTWRSPAELAPLFAHPRCADGTARLFGLSERDLGFRLPHRVVHGPDASAADLLRAVWLACAPPGVRGQPDAPDSVMMRPTAST